MNVKNKHCKFTYHSFFYSKGNVAQCCMQDTLHKQLSWQSVTDLNSYCRDLDEFNEVRTALDDGVKHNACESCWAYEASNIPSMRTQNLYYSDNEKNSTVDIRHVDLRLSNKCNLQCKMCHPGDSDQLAKLASQLPFENSMQSQLPKNNPQDIDILLNLVAELPNLEAIRFAGGEPFIMPEVENFMCNLVARGKTNISIEFITNCTSVKPRMISLLENFKKVDLMCSIDGIKDTFEYQRYPAKWDTVESNFVKLYNSKCNTRIVPCIGLLNYNGLPEFFKWAQNFPKSLITYNEIKEPSFLDFRLIPLEYRISKLDISNNNVSPAWHTFVDALMYEVRPPTNDEVKKLKEYITIWDYRCKEKFMSRYSWINAILEKQI